MTGKNENTTLVLVKNKSIHTHAHTHTHIYEMCHKSAIPDIWEAETVGCGI